MDYFFLLKKGGFPSFLKGFDKFRNLSKLKINFFSSTLGDLLYLNVWHDNSGGSWFLKYIIIHDLKTKEKFYFICNKWLALDKENAKIDYVLPVAGNAQKTEIKYLIEKHTKDNLSDSHLWLSLFFKPTLSSFTRTDRLTCCFVLMLITCMVNLLYYEQDKSTVSFSVKLGPFSISENQVKFKLKIIGLLIKNRFL